MIKLPESLIHVCFVAFMQSFNGTKNCAGKYVQSSLGVKAILAKSLWNLAGDHYDRVEYREKMYRAKYMKIGDKTVTLMRRNSSYRPFFKDHIYDPATHSLIPT
ncbi:hypothetical protein VCHA38O209_50277 [Vibrio chagasii]|nr:hypothetical protein VCHA38O209_50277 [Vibrio chagasii]